MLLCSWISDSNSQKSEQLNDPVSQGTTELQPQGKSESLSSKTMKFVIYTINYVIYFFVWLSNIIVPECLLILGCLLEPKERDQAEFLRKLGEISAKVGAVASPASRLQHPWHPYKHTKIHSQILIWYNYENFFTINISKFTRYNFRCCIVWRSTTCPQKFPICHHVWKSKVGNFYIQVLI